MSTKNIAFLLDAHQIYIPQNGSGTNQTLLIDFFQTISGTFIPLLNMFESLEKDEVHFKIAIAFSAPLCTMLADPVVQEQYIEWLDRQISFGTQELKRCSNKSDIIDSVNFFLRKAKQDKIDFTEKYEQNLIKYFSLFAEKGFLEIVATTATSVFLPHYIDMPEAINAQIETGLYAHRYFFGQPAEGFWLPYLGYTKGLEKNLRSYGIQYTILDSQSILFSETEPVNGLFTPARFYNSLAVFGRDSENQILGEDSFVKNKIYCDAERDSGFELSTDELKTFEIPGSARQATGYCYWNNFNNEDAEGTVDSEVYNPQKAMEQVCTDAETFLQRKNVRLDKAAALLPVPAVSLICTCNAVDLGTKWIEGIAWLEKVIRGAAKYGMNVTSFPDLLPIDIQLQKIKPYSSAAYGAGYGENFLDNSNSWMMRYVRKAAERMIDLAGRFPADTGLKARLLNLGARELLLAQSSELAKMIQEGNNPDYAEKYFKKAIAAFTTVFDSLGSNTVSTEWLTTLEREHSIFPWMNYRIFSKKQ